MTCFCVSTQLTRIMSMVQASKIVTSTSPTGYPLAAPPHLLPAGFRFAHAEMGSAGLYSKRSRHLDRAPLACVTLGHPASSPVGGRSRAIRRNVPRLHCDRSTWVLSTVE